MELWMRLIKKSPQEEVYVDPNLDPVLLVPGIAGSILKAVDEKTGREERVWVRILGADREFRTKLGSFFDPSTGQTVSIDSNSNWKIEVPDDRFGLYAIDVLDPDLVLGRDSVYYFHDMIVEMLQWGFKEGETLFGFGYDFRQSNRFQGTLDRLAEKLEAVYTASGGRKVNIISHSMGGLLVKCFMSLHSDLFEKYVKDWIAIAAPFRGAPGYVTSALLNGVSFVGGWQQNFFVSKWSMHQLLIECPSMYELMACPDFNWENPPLLQVWRKKLAHDLANLESYLPGEAPTIFTEALACNKVSCCGLNIPLPFNVDILNWANETRKVLNSAKVPEGVKFYNIYGTNLDTPHSVCYGNPNSPVSDLSRLPVRFLPNYVYVNGDGTVPAESAMADGLNAVARIGIPAGEHRGILCNRHVFRILKHWLKADHDPYYNPTHDFVILPTHFELDQEHEQGMKVASSVRRDEWEIVAEDTQEREENHDDTSDAKQLHQAGSISVTYVRENLESFGKLKV
ncbi:OLC1v1032053C1 [Oldenlandia corymbosa var. corymbosa]|uniref:OLC1v1032053C1 n=1 Tax=Oldenlandia corymbosa var. corymbosa TaxID=529605 RepID=A0AAV1CKB4_OLDCO|nr:OLC1v1032053C1 [Oldenlandia corymbosa var. corymbosa]